MSNEPTTGMTPQSPGHPQQSLRVELARRESDGVAVTLLWSRATNVAAVQVVDARGGGFELVLSPGESPLDVFHHPYAYAALRGLDMPVPQQATAGCPGCADAAGEAGCRLCRPVVETEVARGLSKLATYLDAWAKFDRWTRSRNASGPERSTA
jgi:hypothetical protein